MKIYLASKSQRRKELLTQMEVEFELLLVDTPELIQPGETAEAFSQRVTREKLAAAWEKIMTEQLQPMPVLCADTEVVLDGKVSGKPADDRAAIAMLKSFSGRAHQVITSVGFRYFDYEKTVLNRTKVTFAHMSDRDIRHYVAMGTYKDKSGGYGIQSYIGQFISRIEGCFYSVMGLPLNVVREIMADLESVYSAQAKDDFK